MTISINSISGYVVVRKREYNFDFQGRPSFNKAPPEWNNIYYGGILRMPWFDLEEKYYQDKSNMDIMKLIEELRARNRDKTGIKIFQDYEMVLEALRISNASKETNELLVIDSIKLREIKGGTQLNKDVHWLGYDVIKLGGWSWIEEGFFIRPDLFSEFQKFLNEDGLFNQDFVDHQLERFVQRYLELAASDIVEPPMNESSEVECIRVGRV